MILTAKKIINKGLELTGLSLCRTETLNKAGRWDFEHERHLLAIHEVERFFKNELFPELPECDNRQELITQLIGVSPFKAYYILHYLHKSLAVKGDICEFGVAEGATSALMANELRKENRKLWLFDSFQGLPRPTAKDILIDDIFKQGSMEAYEGLMSVPQEVVLRRLARWDIPRSRFEIIPGFIEQSAKSANLPKQVCFAYVDFDFYEPILIALKLLDERMPSGGHIVIDDYGVFSSGAATAVDEFAEQNKDRFTLIKPGKFTRGFVILAKN